METRKSYVVRSLVLAGVIAIAGCATTGGAPSKNEDPSVIATRAVERWNLLIASKAEKAYDFLTPGYRATKPRDDYAREMNGRAMRWTNVAYISQECEADTCKVKLSVGYKINLGGPTGNVAASGPVTETWIRSGGKWYALPDALQPTKLQSHTEP